MLYTFKLNRNIYEVYEIYWEKTLRKSYFVQNVLYMRLNDSLLGTAGVLAPLVWRQANQTTSSATEHRKSRVNPTE